MLKIKGIELRDLFDYDIVDSDLNNEYSIVVRTHNEWNDKSDFPYSIIDHYGNEFDVISKDYFNKIKRTLDRKINVD